MSRASYELYTFCIQAAVSLMMITFCFSKLWDKSLTTEDKLLYGSWLTGTISAWSVNPGSRKGQETNNNTYIDSERTSVDAGRATVVTDKQINK